MSHREFPLLDCWEFMFKEKGLLLAPPGTPNLGLFPRHPIWTSFQGIQLGPPYGASNLGLLHDIQFGPPSKASFQHIQFRHPSWASNLGLHFRASFQCILFGHPSRASFRASNFGLLQWHPSRTSNLDLL